MTARTSLRRRTALPPASRANSHRVEPLEPRRLLSAGDLDPTFGGDGKVVTDVVGPVDALAAAVTVALPDGRLVVAGQVRHAGGTNFALARYHADGSLDRTFGTEGRVVTDVPGNAFEWIADADVLPDGKIVVAGTTGPSPYPDIGRFTDFVAARYHPDGTLDEWFGTGGIVVTNIGHRGEDPAPDSNTTDVAAALSPAPGGRLVVVGTNGGDVAVVRYNADGSLDASFGAGAGIVTTNAYPESDDGEVSPSDDAAGDVFVHPDGRILVGGRARGEFLLVRYLQDGSIDRSFGRGHGPDYRPPGEGDEGDFGDPGDPGDGFVTTRFEAGNAAITDLAVWNGRVVAAGTVGLTWETGTGDFGVARYLLAWGTPDRTFSGDGKTTVDFADGRDEASAVLVRGDGTMFLAGYATSPRTLEDFALARLDVRGRPVASFGDDGTVTTDFGTAGGPTVDRAEDATFAADGRIVAAGSAVAVSGGDFGVRGHRFGLARYLPGGALDPTFGPGGAGTGRVSTGFRGSLYNYAADAAIQRDGKVVVAGIAAFDIFLARYNRDGSLDRRFGRGGIVVTDLSPAHDGRSTEGVSAVTLDRYGRILVAGVTDQPPHGATDGAIPRRYDAFVARYWPNGTLDRTFGNGAGFIVTDFGNNDEVVADLAVAPDGRIVIAGETRRAGENWYQIAVARYLTSGAPDVSFGGDGTVLTDLPGPIGEDAGAVAVDASGRVVVAGVGWEPQTGQNFALVRYAADGSLDPSFAGGDGWVTTDFGGWDAAYAVAIQADGRIVAAGVGQTDHRRRWSDFAVARYLADGTPDPSFNGTGRAIYSTDGARDDTADEGRDVHVQPDGKVVLIGARVRYANATPTYSGIGRADFAAVRFRADGTPDGTFGAGGLAVADFGASASPLGGGIDPVGRLVLAGGIFAYDDPTRPTGGDVAVARMLL